MTTSDVFVLVCLGEEAHLFERDVGALQTILPDNAFVKKLHDERRAELSSPEEVRQQLAALKVLDEEMLSDERYPLVPSGSSTSTERELVQELIMLFERRLSSVS